MALAIIGIIGLLSFKGSTSLSKHPVSKETKEMSVDYAIALYTALWPFDGWNSLNLVTGQLRNPARNLPLALVIGLSVVIACYLSTNIAYFAYLSNDLISQSQTLALDFASAAFGNAGKYFISIIICASTFGAANGTMFTGAQLTTIATQSDHAPKFLNAIHSKFQTPFNALILQSVLASFYLIIGNFERLVVLYSFISWLFFVLSGICVLILRIKEPHLRRPFKVWNGFVYVFISSSLFLIICWCIGEPVISLCAIGTLLFGCLVWFINVVKGVSWAGKFFLH